MNYQGTSPRGTIWLPRFQTEIPVSLYINGRQVPPIETDGEIVGLTSSCLQIRCNSKIPIPSRGIIRFSIPNDHEELALSVDFIQRVEIAPGSWFWKMKPSYEMRVSLQGFSDTAENRYKKFINQLIFAEREEDAFNDE